MVVVVSGGGEKDKKHGYHHVQRQWIERDWCRRRSGQEKEWRKNALWSADRRFLGKIESWSVGGRVERGRRGDKTRRRAWREKQKMSDKKMKLRDELATDRRCKQEEEEEEDRKSAGES